MYVIKLLCQWLINKVILVMMPLSGYNNGYQILLGVPNDISESIICHFFMPCIKVI